MFIFLLLQTLFSLNHAQGLDLRCQQVFQSKPNFISSQIETAVTEIPQSFDFVLHRDLRVSEELQPWIFRGPFRERASQISYLYEMVIDPVNLSRLAATFKAVEFDPTPKGRLLWTPWLLLLKMDHPRTDFKPEELVMLWNIHQALDVGFSKDWNVRTRIQLSVRLLKAIKPEHFRSPRPADLSREYVFDRLRKLTPVLVNNVYSRKILEELLSDPKFNNYLHDLFIMFGLDLWGGANSKEISMLLKARKQQLRLKSDQASMFLVHDSLSTIFDYGVFRGQHREQWERAELTREMFLNKMEEMLFEWMDNPSVVDRAVHVFDYILFKSPYPVAENVLVQQVGDSLRRELAPIRDEALARLKQAQLTEKQSKLDLLVRAPQPTTPTATGVNRTELNPNKRRNQKSGDEKREETPRLLSQMKETLTLSSSGESIVANKKYSFLMLRQMSQGVQFIIFDTKVLDFFSNHSHENIQPFLKALEYGFTSRDGSNGIKKLGLNMSLRANIYEIKPGSSSFRILLKRDGDVWTALDVLHKDDIDSFLQNQH